MKGVDDYLKVRDAVQVEGLSKREAAGRFGIDPITVDGDDYVLRVAGLPAHQAAGEAKV